MRPSHEPVIIDTCQWIDYFNRPQSPVRLVIDELLDEVRAVIVGPVVTEILIGIRRKEQADWMASNLRATMWCELEWDDWVEAADLGRSLIKFGHTFPLTDLAIASAALRRDWSVYSVDPHFDLIPALKRFYPQ